MLVVLRNKHYVYQYPLEEAKKEVNKHIIQGEKVDPYNIVANTTTAVVDINTDVGKTLAIYSIPEFVHQSNIQTSFVPLDVTISPDFLLVMGSKVMIVKLFGDDMSQNLCAIKPPDGFEFCCASFRNNAREIYAGVLKEGERQGRVYKYTRGGVGKPLYVTAGCVIDGLEDMTGKTLSVTADGLMAVMQSMWDVKVYSTADLVDDASTKECIMM